MNVFIIRRAMNVHMCLVLTVCVLPRVACTWPKTKFVVTIETSARNTTHPIPNNEQFNLPQNLELKVTSSLRHFNFLLKRRQTRGMGVPILSQDVQPTEAIINQLPENGGLYEGKMSVFILKTEYGKVEYCTGYFEDHRFTYSVHTQSRNNSISRFIMHRYHNRHSVERPSNTLHSIQRANSAVQTTQRPPHKIGNSIQWPLMTVHLKLRSSKTESSVRQPPNVTTFIQQPVKMKPVEMEKTMVSRHRQSRQIQLYEIELLIVVDFSLFKQIRKNTLQLQDRPEDITSTNEDIVHEIMLIVNGIDARFRNIKGDQYVVDVVLAGIFIAQNSTSAPWSESVKKPPESRPVINEDSLKLFAEWTKMNQDILPDFDHAMAITAYNLRNKDNHKTLGLGYKQSMCTDRRYSIIEHHGNTAYVSYIATHELAHSLGSKHDGHPVTVSYGEKTKSCQDDDGFIMGMTASSNPDVLDRGWQFSECSHLYFDFFIDHLNANNTNCMTSTNRRIVTSDQNVSLTTRYTADEQCERTHGLGFVLDRGSAYSDPSDICRSLPCKHALTNYRINTLPLAGTRCGTGRICHLGVCVEGRLHAWTQPMEDDCIFGDQPGSLRTDGLTCHDLKYLESAHECYTFARECCSTCQFHLRKYTNIPNCEYGDRKGSCSARDCDEGMCCETCALLQGLLSECTPQALNEHVEVVYNTPSLHDGTSAMFSCQQGCILNGNMTSVCLDGTWSSTSPHCVIGCRKPIFKDVEHAQLFFLEKQYPVNPMELIHLQCLDGFVLKGPQEVVCSPASRWNVTFPTCVLEYSSPSTVSVVENTPPGVVIHRLYTGNASSNFKMLYFSHPGLKVTKNGRVLVDDGHVINYEHTRSYTVIVEAISIEDPRFNAKQRLTISVRDVNEFAPKFSEDNICIEMTPPMTSESLTRRVHATDLDLYSTNITYGLERSINYAVIDHVTGDITIARADFVNQREVSSLVLKVYATDSGFPKLTGTCSIELRFGKPCPRNNSASGRTCDSMLSVFITVFVHFCLNRNKYC